MIGTVRAKDGAEALLRVLALGVPPADFAKAITGVVSQRLVRKLCESCKEAYTPPPQVLQQLGIPAGRVQAFYRPPQPNPETAEGAVRSLRRHRLLSAAPRSSSCWSSATRSARCLAAGAETRAVAPGRPQRRHENSPGRRLAAGRQGRDLAAGVDARFEVVCDPLSVQLRPFVLDHLSLMSFALPRPASESSFLRAWPRATTRACGATRSV